MGKGRRRGGGGGGGRKGRRGGGKFSEEVALSRPNNKVLGWQLVQRKERSSELQDSDLESL